MNTPHAFPGFAHAVRILTAGLLLAAAAGPASTRAAPAPAAATLIILDASSSMTERIKGQTETKMDIAKRAVRELVEGLPDHARVGLVVYGHREQNNCDDIELLIPAGKLDRTAFISAVNAIRPKGRTPLAASLEFAAKALDTTHKPAAIILVSDGVDTCNGDPCATAARLKASAVGLVIHTVAFNLSAREAQKIACIAAATGGRSLEANDAASLKDALNVAVVEASKPAAPAPAPEPVAEPTPEPPKPEVVTAPEPVIEVTLTGPAAVHIATKFTVAWTGPNGPDDYITIVPLGAPVGVKGSSANTRDGSPSELIAPAIPGKSELRYVSGASQAILGRAAITVSPAAVTLDAPAEAVAGSVIEVAWKGPNNTNDFITIVPKAAEDNQHGNYKYTREGTKLSLTVPGELGACEIRYISAVDNTVLGRREIKAIDSPVTLEAPAEAVAGSVIEVRWKGPDNDNDYVTIVPKAAEDNAHAAYQYTKVGPVLKITTPGELGACEIRYIRGMDNHVLARRDFTTIDSPVTLSAPDQAVAGSVVEVTWKGPDTANDYVTIVPKSAEDNEHQAYQYTKVGPVLKIRTPGALGPCEIRYIRGMDSHVLARRDITTVDSPITLSAATEAPAASPVDIIWTGPNLDGDYITIVLKSAEDNEHAAYKYTKEGPRVRVTAPGDTGPCEIRYIRGMDNRVLARRDLTTIALPITLAGPAEVTAGAWVDITWSGPNFQGDFITVVLKSAADNQHGAYKYTRDGAKLRMAAPIDAGEGEIRYIRGLDNRVLERRPLVIRAAQITLKPPASAAAGSRVKVEWTGPNNQGDLITIVTAEKGDSQHGAYKYTREGSPATIQVPDLPGACEVRYISGQGNKVLARVPMTATAP